jgi:hypothetical protein
LEEDRQVATICNHLQLSAIYRNFQRRNCPFERLVATCDWPRLTGKNCRFWTHSLILEANPRKTIFFAWIWLDLAGFGWIWLDFSPTVSSIFDDPSSITNLSP